MKMQKGPLLVIFLGLFSVSIVCCSNQEYRNNNNALKNPYNQVLTDSPGVPIITETSFIDFNSKHGPEYIDDGLHGSKALHPLNLEDTMSLSSSKRIHENSISFWYKPDVSYKSSPSLNSSETKILITGPGFSLHVNGQNEVGISLQVTTTTKSSYDNHFLIPQGFNPIGENGVWHQIGLTFDRCTTIFYLDGVEVNRFNNSYITNSATNEYIYLGKQTLVMQDGIEIEYQPVNGAVDNIRIFQGQLSEAQMYPLFAGEIGKNYKPQPISRSLPTTGINNVPFEQLSVKWFPHPLINMVSHESTFRFELATDSTFQDLVVEKVTLETIITLPTLFPNTSYYWRVMLEDKEQEGESSIWNFKTELEVNDEDILTVMEFNVLGISPSGTSVARIHGSEYAAEIIRNFTTDLVSLPEGGKMCETVAGILNYFHLRDETSNSRYAPCLLSRYPIVGQSFPPAAGTDKKISSHIQLPDGEVIEFTVLHPRATDSGEVLTMLDISNDEAIDREFKARGNAIIEALDALNAQDNIKNMILAGDLNSVSVLDFTEETSSIHNNRGEVEWPVTSMLRDNGFIDSYRTVHPDPLKDVGDTWSYLYPPTPQGRIDFIFSRGDKFVPISSEVHFNHPSMWITDHNMVVTTYKINRH